MDFKSMKRKELQALCKKHGIAANISSSQMIEKLSSILQVEEKLKPKGCLKGSGGNSVEDLGVLRGESKKVSFVIRDEVDDDYEESTPSAVGKSKSKSTGRSSNVAAKLETKDMVVDKGSGSGSPTNVAEIRRRTTRSRGLAESVLWSPVIEKKRGTKGVRQNAELIVGKEEEGVLAVSPSTRSLRNRVVVVGGADELVADQNAKGRSKKDEDEKSAALLDKDDGAVRKNLRKRSRVGDSVEDMPVARRSTRGSAKLEETVSTEEVDVGRPKKRLKGGTEASMAEKTGGVEIERVSELGSAAKRSRGKTMDSNALEPGDVNEAARQKKARSLEENSGPTRRATRGSSALFEVGDSESAAQKNSNLEGKGARKSKFRKQVNDHASGRGESASLLPDSVVVAEPMKRSTRSSSTLLEVGAASPVKGVEAVGNVKSRKQSKNNGARGGVSARSSIDSESVAEPARRSTRSSSVLLEGDASLPAAGKSIEKGEVVRIGKSQALARGGGLKGEGSINSLHGAEVVAEPARRSTRSSSALPDDRISSFDADKSVKGEQAVRRTRSQRQVKEHGLREDGSTTSASDAEVVVAASRLTRRSSDLLKDGNPLSTAGKSSKGGEMVKKGKSQNQAKDGGRVATSLPDSKVVVEPVRRSTPSSPLLETGSPLLVPGKIVKDGEAVKKNRSQKQGKDHASETRVSTGSAIGELTNKLTRSSSKTLEDKSHAPVVRKFSDTDEATGNDKGKRQAELSSEKQSSVLSELDSEAATTTKNRLTRSSSKLLREETFSFEEQLGPLVDTITKDCSEKQAPNNSLQQGDSAPLLVDNKATTTPSRRSARHSSRVPADSEFLKSPSSLLNSETVTATTRRSTLSSSNVLGDEIFSPVVGKLDSHSDIFRKDSSRKPREHITEHGDSTNSLLDKKAVTTPTSSSILSSSKVPADSEALKSPCSSHVTVCRTRSTPSSPKVSADNIVLKSPGSPCPDDKPVTTQPHVNVDCEVLKDLGSLNPASNLSEDIWKDAHVKAKDSREEHSSLTQPIHAWECQVDMMRTSIGSDMLEEQNVPSGNLVDASKSDGGTAVAGEMEMLVSDISLSLDLSVNVESACRGTRVSNDIEANVVSQLVQSPVSCRLENIEGRISIFGTSTGHNDVSLGFREQCSAMDVAENDRDELPANIIERSSHVQGNFTDQLRCSSVNVTVESEGIFESHEDDRDTFSGGVGCSNSVTEADDQKILVGSLEVDDLAGLESQNFASHSVHPQRSDEQTSLYCSETFKTAHLKVPDSTVEVNAQDEEILTCNEAMHASNLYCSANEVSPGIASDEPTLNLETCGAAEVGLQGNNAADICSPALVRKISDEHLPMSETNAEFDSEESKLKWEVEGAHGELMSGSGADIASDLGTSNAEVCDETFRDINIEESDSKGDVLVAAKEAMDGTEAINIAGSSLSCKFLGALSSSLLPTLLNEVSEDINTTVETDASPGIDFRDSEDINTHAVSKAVKVSDAHDKTLDVPMTTTSASGSPSDIQRIFDDEVEKSKVDSDTMLNAQAVTGEYDAIENIEDSTDSRSPGIDFRESEDINTHAVSKAVEASDAHDKTLDVPVTTTSASGSPSDIQSIFDDEVEESKVDSDTMLNAQAVTGEYDAIENIEVSTDSRSPGIDFRESEDINTHAVSKAVEVSDAHDKTLDVPVITTASGSPSDIQRFFEDEVEKSKVDSDAMLNAQVVTGEYDAMEKIEDSTGCRVSQSCIHMEVIKETWVSSTLLVTVNDDSETAGDKKCAKKSGDELKPSSQGEKPACDPCLGDHIMEHRPTSSAVEIVDNTSTLYSHGNAQESDFAQCLDDVDPNDVEWKPNDFFNDKFCEGSSNHFQSSVASMKPEGPSCVLPLQPIGLAGCNRLVNKLEEEDILLAVNVESTRIMALTSDNRFSSDADLFGDGEDSRHLSNKQEVALDVPGNLVVDSADGSPGSPSKEPVALEQLNEVADILPETANIADELPDFEQERSIELGERDDQATKNMTSLEFKASFVGEDDTEMNDAESIGWNKLNDFDEVEVKQDEPSPLQKSRSQSEELHLGHVASHPTLDNSASMPGEKRVLSPANVALPMDLGNDRSLPIVDVIPSDEEQSAKENSEKASAKEETMKSEEYPSSVSLVPPANQKENQAESEESDMSKEKTPAGSVGLEELPEAYLVDSQSLGDIPNDVKGVGEEMESRLPCVVQEIDHLKDPLPASADCSEEERASVSPIKSECVLETREEDIPLCTSEDFYFVSADTFQRIDNNSEAVYNNALPECGSEDAYNASDSKDVVLKEDPDYNSVVASPKITEAESGLYHNTAGQGLDHNIKFSVSVVANDYGVAGISENNEASTAGDQTLAGSGKQADLGSEKCWASVVSDSSGKLQAQQEESNNEAASARQWLLAASGKQADLGSEKCSASVVTDSSGKLQTQQEESNNYGEGTLECYEQPANVEAEWITSDERLLFAEDLFYMDSEVSNFVNDSTKMGQSGFDKENLGRDYSEAMPAKSVAAGEVEMKAMGSSGHSDAKSEDAYPCHSEMPSIAEKLLDSSTQPLAGMDSQATCFDEQSKSQAERTHTEETPGVTTAAKDEMLADLYDNKIKVSSTETTESVESKITLTETIAKKGELTAGKCTELYSQVVLFDDKERFGEDMSIIGNQREDLEFIETGIAQHALPSIDTGDGVDRTSNQESMVGEDETKMPEEYLKDSFQPFADTVDVDSSFQELDSHFPKESTTVNSADHSANSGNEEGDRSSGLEQIEDIKDSVSSMHLDRDTEHHFVIDDNVIRNKENTVGLKMDSTRRQNEKSAITNSSRKPLQSVRRTSEP